MSQEVTEDDAEDDFIDWFAFDERLWELDDKGYAYTLLGNNLSKDMHGDLGDYVLVKDEFMHGDVVFIKELPNAYTRAKLGLSPLSLDTKKAAKAADILDRVGAGDTVELFSKSYKWAAAVHPCARPGCEYQGSMFDSRGPIGHVEADSFPKALEALFNRAPDWEVYPGIVDEIVLQATDRGQFKHPLTNNPPSGDSLKELSTRLQGMGVDSSFMRHSNTSVVLSKIKVDGPKGTGAGTEAMNLITDWADENDQELLLTPSTDFGGSSVARLKKFYKRFGFLENKGRNRDYSHRESMFRKPL